MSKFLEVAKNKVIFFDGAMGTSLFRYDLDAEDYGGKEMEGCPENLNYTKPEIIQEIHASFLAAGADVIETNTFGASSLVLAEYDIADKSYDVSKCAASLAREVADEYSSKKIEIAGQEITKPRFVAGSIGPGTKLASLGHISFDELSAAYLEQVRGLIDGQVDVLIIETCQDPLQIKACLDACYKIFRQIDEATKSLTDDQLLSKYPKAIIVPKNERRTGLVARFRMPIIVQVTVEQMGTLLVGSEIASVLTTIASYPIDVIGMNCATGPAEMREHIRYLCDYSPYLVSCLPNAGIPENVGGHAHYPLDPNAFTEGVSDFIDNFGVNIIGGCCGTTPEHIKALVSTFGESKAKKREAMGKFSNWIIEASRKYNKNGTAEVHRDISEESFVQSPLNSVSSLYSSTPMLMRPAPLMVGERTNANGSKLFKELLAADDYEGIVELAKGQIEEGAHVLDVCTAYVGRDEMKDMLEVVGRLNTVLSIPIMLDSTEYPVLEAGLKLIAGKAIINSVNLEDGEERVEKIAALANRYAAALVVLTIDENGMAKTAAQKFAVAERLYDLLVNKHGVKAQDLIFDTLTFTLGAGDEDLRSAGIETIEAIRMIKNKYPEVKTILGLSNISFGLDAKLRAPLNSIFLFEAVKAGLDMSICNSKKIIPLNKIDDNVRKLCEDLVYDRRKYKDDDKEAELIYDPLMELIACLSDIKEQVDDTKDRYADMSVEEILSQRIIDGNKVKIEKDLEEAMSKGYNPLDIINKFLMDGMKVVGERFGAGEMQLPFVLQSATAMKTAVAYLEQFMENKSGNSKGTIVLATVKGDVHDIGKNLVDIILSNNGYIVHNLGIKQSIDLIIKAIEEYKPDVVGLSGLLVKSTLIMKQDLDALNHRGISVPVILGGAALTRRFVEEDCAKTYKGTVFYGFDAFTDLHILEKICSGENLANVKEEFYKSRPEAKSEKDEAYQSVEDTVKEEASQQETFSFIDKISQTPVLKEQEIPQAPFYGSKLVDFDSDWDKLWQYLNLDALIIGQWRFGKAKLSKEEYQEKLENIIYPELERLKASVKVDGWLQAQAIYAYYPCRLNEDNPNQLDIYYPTKKNRDYSQAIENKDLDSSDFEKVESFVFPRQRSKENLCLADYFQLDSKNAFNTVAFQIVTMGQAASDHSQKLYEAGEFTDYLYSHGLSVETTEAMAEFVHARIRQELNIAGEDDPDYSKLIRSHYHGMRYSFGYPACPRLEDHEQLFRLLKPERIGIVLADEWQMHPEQSTSAIVVHHPEAKYYNVN